MRKNITLIFLLFIVTVGYTQSINGTAAVSTGLDYNYSLSGTTTYADPYWEASGGIVVSQSAGVPYTAVVHWTTPGSGYIRFRNGAILTTKTTTITDSGVPVPVTTFSFVNNCGNTVVTRNSGPTPATSYDWYWQTTQYGTSTTLGTSSSITRTVATNFYLRAKLKASPYAWSTTSKLVSGVTISTVAPTAPTASTGASGFVNTSIPLSVGTVSGATSYLWYTMPSGGTAVSGITSATYSTPGLTTTTTYYVSSSNGCESATRKSVVATVVPLPVVQVQNGLPPNIVFGKSIMLVTTLPYDTYSWTNSANQVVSTTATCVVSQPGIYKVSVTKAGITGPGVSLSFSVRKGTSGMDMNYIITNTILANNLSDTSLISGYPTDSVNQSIQYFDGLGRPLQTVLTQGSPSKNDIVQPIVYDAFGREVKKYLPFAPSDGSGWYKSNIISAAGNYTGIAQGFYQLGSINDIADDTIPFAQTVFESSPLNRILKQGAPGTAWQPNATASLDHSVKKAYEFNKDNEVILFTYVPTNGSVNHYVTSGTTGVPIYYAKNRLFATKTIDEHNNEVIEFVNNQGQTLLRKVQYAAGKYTSTYYVYDDLGMLRVVLSPESINRLALEYLATSVTQTAKESFLARWSFRYKYDSRLRMVEKQVPGADPVYMVYDDRDRLVMTQDGNQRPKKEWQFTKYDTINRPVMTGVYTHSALIDQTAMSALISKTKFCESFSNLLTTNHGYTSNVFPKTGYKALTITYYDDYRFRKMISDSVNYTYNADGVGIGTEFKRLKDLVTGTKINILNSANYLWTANYYDERSRLIQAVSQNHKAGRDRLTMSYDFVGRVMQTKTNHSTSSTSHATYRKMEYDHGSRIIKVSHKINTEPWIILMQNSYNELGQLISKKNNSRDNGSTFAQKTDYIYNIRGWLQKINDPVAPEVGDLFSTELKYDMPTANGGIAQYNGNISETILKSAGIDLQSYGYYYDTLNRLKEARYFDLARPIQNGRYNEIIGGINNKGYDLNGNILKLTRNGKLNATPQGTFDNLKYSYVGNQLKVVNDAVVDNVNEEGFKELVEKTFTIANTDAQNEYSYDKNGSMLKDDNKGITSITYNYLNLPRKVYKTGADSVVYTYDATGRKLSQQVYGTTPKITDYLGEFLYENSVLQFVTQEEGRLLPDVSAGAPHPWEYQYFLKDHLGNVRVTFSEKKTSTEFKATLENDTQTTESTNFRNYGNRSAFQVYNHTVGTGYTYSQLLNAGNNSQVGLAKSMTVNPGDVLDLEVYAKYEQPATSGTNVNTLLTALSSAFSLGANTTPLDGASAQTAFNGLFIDGGPWITSTKWEDASAPKAYLNYILFDQNFALIDFGFDQISVAAMQDGVTPVVPHDYLNLHVKVQQKGYLYVYLSNENAVQANVYFDDFKITYNTGIESVTGYYAFGLQQNSNSFQKQGSTQNPFTYNGKEIQDELNLGWLDYGARMYMSDIGRWGTVDPLAEKGRRWSPYTYAFDNPIRFIDPDGMWAVNDKGNLETTDPAEISKVLNWIKSNSKEEKAEDADSDNKEESEDAITSPIDKDPKRQQTKEGPFDGQLRDMIKNKFQGELDDLSKMGSVVFWVDGIRKYIPWKAGPVPGQTIPAENNKKVFIVLTLLAFKSANDLQVTLAHEFVHARDVLNGNYQAWRDFYVDEDIVNNIMENHAYQRSKEVERSLGMPLNSDIGLQKFALPDSFNDVFGGF